MRPTVYITCRARPAAFPSSAHSSRHVRIVFLAVALSVFHGLLAGIASAKLQDRIVAVVNSDLIMLSDVKRDLMTEQERLQKRYKGMELERRLKSAEYMTLTKMIERKLQLQAARNKGVEVTDLEVTQAIDELMKQGDKNIAKDDNKATTVREELLLLRVVDREVRSVVMVLQSDMKRYYQEHQERFAYPEEYQLSQILIRPRSADEAGIAIGRGEAILAALKQGESFEDLALRFSEGPNASRGGRLGLVRQGELLPVIEQALASLPIGGITPLIESPDGLHIIRVDDKKPRQFRPFEEVKAEIQTLVFQQKSEDQYQIWMADLKNKAYIDIKF